VWRAAGGHGATADRHWWHTAQWAGHGTGRSSGVGNPLQERSADQCGVQSQFHDQHEG